MEDPNDGNNFLFFAFDPNALRHEAMMVHYRQAEPVIEAAAIDHVVVLEVQGRCFSVFFLGQMGSRKISVISYGRGRVNVTVLVISPLGQACLRIKSRSP